MNLIFFIVQIIFLLPLESTSSIVDNSVTSPNKKSNFLTDYEKVCKQKREEACIFLPILKKIEIVFNKPVISVSEHVKIIKNRNSEVQNMSLSRYETEFRSLEPKESIFGKMIYDRMLAFLQTRAIRWNVSNFFDMILSSSPQGKIKVEMLIDGKEVIREGRGKMKKSGPLIASIVLKGALIGILAFKALFLLSGKALLISKLAFLFSSLIGANNLFQKNRQVTYEIFSPSEHTYA